MLCIDSKSNRTPRTKKKLHRGSGAEAGTFIFALLRDFLLNLSLDTDYESPTTKNLCLSNWPLIHVYESQRRLQKAFARNGSTQRTGCTFKTSTIRVRDSDIRRILLSVRHAFLTGVLRAGTICYP